MVPEAEGLNDAHMQKIAAEATVFETAFVFDSSPDDVKVRYFTPHLEIPFAGHATIATATMMVHEGKCISCRSPITIDFEFNIGLLPVEITIDPADNSVEALMTQQNPSFGGTDDKDDLMEWLGLNSSDFFKGLPIQVINTGVPFLMAPVNGMAILKKLCLNRSLVRALLERLGVDTVYLFCLEGFSQEGDASGRLLTPASGAEAPCTGFAVSSMGAYIGKYKLLTGLVFTAEPGHLLGRPGKATVGTIGSNTDIDAVRGGGSAVETQAGQAFVNH